jgi:hypothetical protein
MVKLPLPPVDLAGTVGIRVDEYRQVAPDTLLWRIHRVRGGLMTPWNQLRHYGPLDARFEPHPPPPAHYDDRAVWYAAMSPRTAFAEVFQRTRTVPLTDTFHLTAARLTRPVPLLDITGDPDHDAWATRAGASMALSTGRHDYTSAWVRELCGQFPSLHGLAYRAAMDGGLAVALFLPAADAMPRQAVASRALSDPAMTSRIAGICHTIGYRLVQHQS